MLNSLQVASVGLIGHRCTACLCVGSKAVNGLLPLNLCFLGPTCCDLACTIARVINMSLSDANRCVQDVAMAAKKTAKKSSSDIVWYGADRPLYLGK